MKQISKRVKGLIIILFFCFIAFYTAMLLIVNLWGKDLLAGELEKRLSRKVSVANVTLTYSLKLKIEKLVIDGILIADKVYLSQLPINVLSENLTFGKITINGLSIKLNKNEIDLLLASAKGRGGSGGGVSVQTNQLVKTDVISDEKVNVPDISKKTQKNIVIRHLIIKNSEIVYVDAMKKGVPLELKIGNLTLDVQNLNFGDVGSTKMDVDLKADVPWDENAKCKLSVKGWVDYPKRDMLMKVVVKNFEYVHFGDYYPWKFRPATLGLESLYLNLAATLDSQSNNLNVRTLLDVGAATYVPVAEGEEVKPRTKIFKTVLQLFQGKNNKPKVELNFDTKMDNPRIDIRQLKSELLKQSGLNIGEMFNIAITKVSDDPDGTLKKAPATAVAVTRTVVEDAISEADDSTKELVGGIFDILNNVLADKNEDDDNTSSEQQKKEE